MLDVGSFRSYWWLWFSVLFVIRFIYQIWYMHSESSIRAKKVQNVKSNNMITLAWIVCVQYIWVVLHKNMKWWFLIEHWLKIPLRLNNILHQRILDKRIQLRQYLFVPSFFEDNQDNNRHCWSLNVTFWRWTKADIG